MIRLLLLLTTILLLAGCASTSEKQQTPISESTSQTRPWAYHDSGEFASILLKKPEAGLSVDQAPDDIWQRLRKGFGLPELNNKRVAYYERYFSRNPQQFYRMVDRAQWFLPYILDEVEKRGYPSELALLPAVESGFITSAKSRSSASGLWQFIPDTGKLYKLRQDWWYDGRRDPVFSTQAALKFLSQLDQRFDGNWFHALAAYNAGGWTIERAIRNNVTKRKSTHFNDLPLRRETRDYVPKLVAYRNIFRDPGKYGLSLPALGNAQQFASIDVGTQIDVSLFAQKAGIDARTMRFLNSAYLKNITPPNGPHILHIPATALESARTTLAGLSRNDRMRWAHYQVKKGDVLGGIARNHGVSVATIKQSNRLHSNLIHPGDILLIPVIGRGSSVVTSSGPSKTGKVSHHVRQGDTLWDLARRYKVKVSQISRWNQIDQANPLKLGQVLTIYTRS